MPEAGSLANLGGSCLQKINTTKNNKRTIKKLKLTKVTKDY